MDTWTSISKVRTAKAEFCGSKMSSALKEPRNSALAVLILEIDVHVSTYLLLSGRTLESDSVTQVGSRSVEFLGRTPGCRKAKWRHFYVDATPESRFDNLILI